MVKHVEELWGSIDILVNNAGIMFYTSMSSLKLDAWDKMVDVNCKGVLNGIGAVLPGMVKCGRGHIINISSDSGIRVNIMTLGLGTYLGGRHCTVPPSPLTLPFSKMHANLF